MPSAWMSPEGTVIPIHGEHELEIARIADLEGPDAIYSGWVRMIRSPAGGPGMIDGMPKYIERNKDSALTWLRWPKVVIVDAEQEDGSVVSFETSSDELLDRSVQSLVHRERMQFPPHMARRPVRVRSHRRRA